MFFPQRWISASGNYTSMCCTQDVFFLQVMLDARADYLKSSWEKESEEIKVACALLRRKLVARLRGAVGCDVVESPGSAGIQRMGRYCVGSRSLTSSVSLKWVKELLVEKWVPSPNFPSADSQLATCNSWRRRPSPELCLDFLLSPGAERDGKRRLLSSQ